MNHVQTISQAPCPVCRTGNEAGEVAKRANMAESTLTARMTGRLPWNGDEIARVAKVLDIPADQIGAFFFEDAPKEYKKGA